VLSGDLFPPEAPLCIFSCCCPDEPVSLPQPCLSENENSLDGLIVEEYTPGLNAFAFIPKALVKRNS
jgi:hypothetical protein